MTGVLGNRIIGINMCEWMSALGPGEVCEERKKTPLDIDDLVFCFDLLRDNGTGRRKTPSKMSVRTSKQT